MFDFSEVTLNKMVVHNIGNRVENEGVRLSKSVMDISDQTVEAILKQYFLSSFKTDYFYNFSNESDLQLNEVYNLALQIFNDPQVFYEHSVNLTHLLYDRSNHPKIKTGEFYMVYFSNINVDGEIVEGLGLFKSETKDTYLRVYQNNENFEVDYDNGINIKKLDKGCLIFNTETELGFKVSIIDTTNKAGEALYWRDDFLGVSPRENEFYQTNQLIDLCKGFSEQILNQSHNVDKQEQVNFVKRTESYFNNNEIFDNEEFKTNVIDNEDISEAFEVFKQEFEEKRNLSPTDQFQISAEALKQGKKFFRSIIKLDKNFHIYVHANPDFIQKGIDNAKGLKFYKLYYHEES